MTSSRASRSQALLGNASLEAPLPVRVQAQNAKRSFVPCVPKQSLGTRSKRSALLIEATLQQAFQLVDRDGEADARILDLGDSDADQGSLLIHHRTAAVAGV